MSASEMSGRIADAVLMGLCDRKGIGDELSAVQYDDPETWEEIRQAVGNAAIEAMPADPYKRAFEVLRVALAQISRTSSEAGIVDYALTKLGEAMAIVQEIQQEK